MTEIEPNENSFASRLKKAMNDSNMKQVDIIRIAEEKGIKLGKSHISQYVSGKTVPRAEMIGFLAETLNVDKDWLSGNKISANKLSDNMVETQGYLIIISSEDTHY